jgi:hypothetical protein
VSRRKRRRNACPLCWDMGADAPAVTHRVVRRYNGSLADIFGPGFGPHTERLKVCTYHAVDTMLSLPRRTKVYRLKGRRR